jgi:hypothetical protein
MSVSLMLTVALLDFILSSIDLMCSMFSCNFKHMLSVFSKQKSLVFNLIGVVSITTSNFFQKLGISHRVSCPHTHQQNGVAERKHRHIVETGLTLLAHASVLFCYWSDASTIACFLINRFPTRLLHMKTPFELLLHETPDYTFLKVFGCVLATHSSIQQS